VVHVRHLRYGHHRASRVPAATCDWVPGLPLKLPPRLIVPQLRIPRMTALHRAGVVQVVFRAFSAVGHRAIQNAVCDREPGVAPGVADVASQRLGRAWRATQASSLGNESSTGSSNVHCFLRSRAAMQRLLSAMQSKLVLVLVLVCREVQAPRRPVALVVACRSSRRNQLQKAEAGIRSGATTGFKRVGCRSCTRWRVLHPQVSRRWRRAAIGYTISFRKQPFWILRTATRGTDQKNRVLAPTW
jgi:hypothetical protein